MYLDRICLGVNNIQFACYDCKNLFGFYTWLSVAVAGGHYSLSGTTQ